MSRRSVLMKASALDDQIMTFFNVITNPPQLVQTHDICFYIIGTRALVNIHNKILGGNMDLFFSWVNNHVFRCREHLSIF